MTYMSIYNRLHITRRQRGLSLIELMISITIGLILLLGLTMLMVQQSQTRDELEKSSRQIENGRYAMQILHDDIQHAGFYGQYYILPAPPNVLPDPCTTLTSNLIVAMPLAIQGYNAPTASPIACLNNANFLSGTDILVVRRADTNAINFDAASPPLTLTALAAGLVYVQTNSTASVMGVGAGVKGSVTSYPLVFDGPPNGPGNIHAPLRPYNVRIYFVSPCSVPADGSNTCTGAGDDNGRPIPTLKRMDLSSSGGVTSFVITPLVEGIENMQLDYGLDTDTDGYPDSFNAAPASTIDWSNVMVVSVNLLARNNEPTTGYIDSKSYTLGSTAVTAPANATNYKRHVFSELVRVVNPSSRRALQ